MRVLRLVKREIRASLLFRRWGKIAEAAAAGAVVEAFSKCQFHDSVAIISVEMKTADFHLAWQGER